LIDGVERGSHRAIVWRTDGVWWWVFPERFQ
jgi:hypothetical protein